LALLPRNLGASAYTGPVNTLCRAYAGLLFLQSDDAVEEHRECHFQVSTFIHQRRKISLEARQFSATNVPDNMVLVEPESGADKYEVLEIIGKIQLASPEFNADNS
jgi:hypothetical protein